MIAALAKHRFTLRSPLVRTAPKERFRPLHTDMWNVTPGTWAASARVDLEAALPEPARLAVMLRPTHSRYIQTIVTVPAVGKAAVGLSWVKWRWTFADFGLAVANPILVLVAVREMLAVVFWVEVCSVAAATVDRALDCLVVRSSPRAVHARMAWAWKFRVDVKLPAARETAVPMPVRVTIYRKPRVAANRRAALAAY